MSLHKALTKKQIEQLQKVLMDERKKISHHLNEISDDAEEGLQNGAGDSADIASAEINQAALQKIGKREEFLLKKIDLALQKITDGTYGECESCGDPIGFPRLNARPVAQLCIDCKTEQEANERKFSNREASADDGDGISEEIEEAE
jgi:DnaK suppressor protein